MENPEELFVKVEKTLERYRKNKTFVPKAELDGKYKNGFERLKQSLVKELKEYVAAVIYSGMIFPDDAEGHQVLDEISKYMMDSGFFKKVAEEAFSKFNMQAVKHLTQMCHGEIYKQIWCPYFDRHTALYIIPENFNSDNPQIPEIYNDIVDKFYDEAEERWITKQKPPGEAVLLFVRKDLG